MTDEQIEKVSQEYADSFIGSTERKFRKSAFADGVRFALSHQWTSVDERLPEDDRLVLVRLNFNFGCSGYDIARYNKYWRCQLASRCGDGATISHWCEIPPLNPEKEEV